MVKKLRQQSIRGISRWPFFLNKIVKILFLPAFSIGVLILSTHGIFSDARESVGSSLPEVVSSPAATASPSPSPVSPVCVTAHLDSETVTAADIDTQLALLRDVGSAWVRFDIELRKIEKSPGTYDFSQFDPMIQKANDMGISVIAILPQWGAPHQEYFDLIQTPERYAAYAAAVAKHYQGNTQVVFQIGNEPDVKIFWNEKPDSMQYVSYLKAAAAAIKQVNPDARVISAGTLSENTVEWTTHQYEQGALVHVDDIGLHLYSQPNPPRFTVIDQLIELMKYYNDPKNIAITEFGWPTMRKEDHIEGVTDEKQAAYIIEVFHRISETYPAVRTICVYNLRDTGTERNNVEHHMGLVTWDYTKKPAYDAMKIFGNIYQR